FNDTATTEIYTTRHTLSLHDALPISPSIVLHDYIPELLQKLRTKFPEFRLCLHEAARAEAERLLLARDVDLAITLIEKKSRAGIEVRPLLELPLILLVHRKSKLARAEDLWKLDKIEET